MIAINFDKLEVALKKTLETPNKILGYDIATEIEQGDFLLCEPVPCTDFCVIWKVIDKTQNAKIGLFFGGYRKFKNNADYCKLKFDDSLFYADDYDFLSETMKFCNTFGLFQSHIAALDVCFDSDEDCIFPQYKLSPDKSITHRARGQNGGLTLREFVIAAVAGNVARDQRFNRAKTRTIEAYQKHDQNKKEQQQKEQKKNMVKACCSVIGKGRADWDTHYWGEYGGYCCARIYNKTKEMIKHGEKTFITGQWNKREYDGKNDVWRFEIAMAKLGNKANTVTACINNEFVLIKNALPYIRRKYAAGLFFALLNEYFCFRTFGGNSSRKTKFCNELSYNCGYVTKVKRYREYKQQKDLIKYNNITRWFPKYVTQIFTTNEAKLLFTNEQINKALEFNALYTELHEAYNAQINNNSRLLAGEQAVILPDIATVEKRSKIRDTIKLFRGSPKGYNIGLPRNVIIYDNQLNICKK